MERILLEFEDVYSRNDENFKLYGITFAIPAGYIMGLMGENGAGKSTLFNYILNDKKRYSKGVIRVDGVDIREDHGAIKNKIGFVSEDNVFFENMTAMQNAQLLGIFYDEFDMELFKNSMKEMEVSTGTNYSRMSRGEKLKFQMAFAMAHKPVIYLLDEVTVGMDPVFRMDFFKVLQEVIKDEQASVLMTSHIESEMERKTDYLGIMENGEIIKFGESLDVVSGTEEEEWNEEGNGN